MAERATKTLLDYILPPVLGAVGAILASAWPMYHAAICSANWVTP